MRLPSLRFNGEILPHNPHTLRISYARDIRQITVPNVGEIYGGCGKRARVVTGEGELCGDNALRIFLNLADIHDKGDSGILSIPDIPPFEAVLKELTLTREPKDGVIGYSFKFMEKCGVDGNNGDNSTVVTLDEASDLWGVAARYGRAIEALVINNPDIETPYTVIPAGSEVRL